MDPTTLDGHYFVIKGQHRRCSNPSLGEEERQHLVNQLMAARRAVKDAKESNAGTQLKIARSRVHVAKLPLVSVGIGADEELTHLLKTTDPSGLKATTVCAGYLTFHVGAVAPQQLGQFRISANMR